MTRTVNIITAVYIGDNTEYGYEKNKAYGLKLTQDDQFPIVVMGLKELLYRRRRNQTKPCLLICNSPIGSVSKS